MAKRLLGGFLDGPSQSTLDRGALRAWRAARDEAPLMRFTIGMLQPFRIDVRKVEDPPLWNPPDFADVDVATMLRGVSATHL